MAIKTKAQRLEDKLTGSKRQYDILKFPLDVDTDATQNIMMININTISGSKFNGKQYTRVEGGDVPRVEQQSSNSLSRHLKGNTTRIKTTIALHMPPSITTSYSAEWGASNLETAGAILDAWKGSGDLSERSTWKEIWETIKGAAGPIAKLTAVKMVDVITPGKLTDAYTFANQFVQNPYVEVMFRGISNRTFSFTFKFIPRSPAEQKEIKKIVDTLKFHRAPEKKANTKNLYWAYPSTFDITFLKKDGQENDWLFKISTCALTDLNVTQGSDSHFASYEDGSPFSTTITLNFTELEILDKSRILAGF